VTYHVDLAYARGLLTGPNLGTLQELCLQTYLSRQEIKSLEEKQNDFEMQLLLHRPEMYEKYMEEKKEKEESGFDHIIWKEPESMEEIELILAAIQKTEETVKEDNEIDSSIELNFINKFEGVDLSEIGDIDNEEEEI
jgi:hypothetical protein